MRTVDLVLTVAGVTPADTYTRICDFARYPDLCTAVRSVTVSEASERQSVSQWEVDFRGGLLRWTEQDTFDAAARTITFRQLEGDVAGFDGTWCCTEAGSATRIRFTARLDLGIPSLADALEPIAARALIDNTTSIVRGLFGSADVESSAHSPAAAEPMTAAIGDRR